MTPLPGVLSPARQLVAWRLDAAERAAVWDSGMGAEQFGGRWNPKGVRTVYCSLDPATAILESTVHRGSKILDTLPFVFTCVRIADPTHVHVVQPETVYNQAWLAGGSPSAGQQQWGAELLRKHLFVVLPGVVSRLSWNLIFDPARAVGQYTPLRQEPLVLDTRLNPPLF